jgi:hypothetical protein
MRLTINIDNMPHQIDSTDPELIGKWVAEIFARAVAFGITPATQIQVQIYPSWIPDETVPGGRPDWIADTRIIGHVYEIRTPRELVKVLSDQLDDAEVLP